MLSDIVKKMWPQLGLGLFFAIGIAVYSEYRQPDKKVNTAAL